MKTIKLIIIAAISFAFISCSNINDKADAYGNFEANEIIISAETAGKIIKDNFQEGSKISVNDILCVIDTVQLHLKKEQLMSSISAIESKTQDLNSQIEVYEKRKENLLREKNRFEKLYRDSAATKKQIDDLNGELEVIEKQIIAAKTAINTGNRGLLSERDPILIQISQIQDQINKSYILSPISSIILTKYIELGEYAVPGKPLYKIANTDELILKAYISGTQLSSIKIGQKVKVYIDAQDNNMKELSGELYWVSEKAEFTPKIIQTKEERVNLVYAIKIKVKNDGSLKIGMPAEVKF